MIITRISNNFTAIDTAYSELYENEISLENKITRENKEKLLKSLSEFERKLKNYKNAVKNLYISDKNDYFEKVN